MNELKQNYYQKIRTQLLKELKLSNIHQVPKITKVIVNSGVGRATSDPRALELVEENLAKITGQQPLITKAKKSIAGFKLKEGDKIGAKVTLRGERMYFFLDRLMRVVIPRIRDFRGLSPNAFDSQAFENILFSLRFPLPILILHMAYRFKLSPLREIKLVRPNCLKV